MKINDSVLLTYNKKEPEVLYLSKKEIAKLPIVSKEGTSAIIRSYHDFLLKEFFDITTTPDAFDLLGYSSPCFMTPQVVVIDRDHINAYLMKPTKGHCLTRKHPVLNSNWIRALVIYDQELQKLSHEHYLLSDTKLEHFFYSEKDRILATIDTDEWTKIPTSEKRLLQENRKQVAEALMQLEYPTNFFDKRIQEKRQQVQVGMCPYHEYLELKEAHEFLKTYQKKQIK